MYGTRLVPDKRRLSIKVLDRRSLQLNEPAADNFEWKRYTHLADNENGVLYERPNGLNACAQIEISGDGMSVRQDVRVGS